MPARAQKRRDAGDERGEGREPGVHGAREGGEGGGVRALGYARVEVGSAGDGADGDLCGRARETISRGKARGRGREGRGGGRGTHGDDGADEEGVVVAQDDVVCAPEARVELCRGVCLRVLERVAGEGEAAAWR